MRFFVIILLSCFLVSTAILASEDIYAKLNGIWVFDSDSTRTNILSLPNWTKEMTDHVMSAYGAHEYTISGNTYALRYKDKNIEGTIEISAIRGGTFRVRFTCPNQEVDEVGTIEATENTMIYRSHTPMFKGESLHYKRKRS